MQIIMINQNMTG